MAESRIKYPIYVISKGRFDKCLTARFLVSDNIQFYLVVEPQEFDEYERRFAQYAQCTILTLPFSNLGQGSIPARNWCWQHSIENNHSKHWIVDDNISGMVKWSNNKRVKCNSREAFETCEQFVDQFSNVAIAGINYRFHCPIKQPKFYLNHHAYSCLLIRNDLSFRWRGRYNEDTDLCLQALTNNWCTININVYLINKAATMSMKGGNTDELYQDRGRLVMARSLELAWSKYPGLVKTVRKWSRPQHQVDWKRFKTKLKTYGQT